MPVDPGSIIAYIGISLAVLSAAASTVGNLHAQYKRYRDCKSILEFNNQRMKGCRGRLEEWKSLWSSDPGVWSDATYQMYWGEDGYKEALNMVDGIRKDLDRIGKSLFGDLVLQIQPGATSHTHWHLWNGVVKKIENGTGPDLDVAWYERVCFAVAAKQSLEDLTTRFKERVDNLIAYTERFYWRNRSMEGTSDKITPGILRLDARREKWLADHRTGLNLFYRAVSASSTDWDMQLYLPNRQGGGIECMDVPVPLRVGFHIWDRETRNRGEGSLGTLADIYRQFESRTIVDVTTGVLPTGATEGYMTYGKALAQMQSARVTPNNTRRLSEILRARAAVALVNWVILVWKTDWTSPLCSCGLAFLLLSVGGQWTHTYSTTQANARDGQIHLPESLANRRLLHLGVAIAELGLGLRTTPILTDRGRIKYIVGDRTIRETLERDLLIERLAFECSVEYAEACQECLTLAEELDPSYDYRPQDLVILKNAILDPLEKHHRELQAHRNSLPLDTIFRFS